MAKRMGDIMTEPNPHRSKRYEGHKPTKTSSWMPQKCDETGEWIEAGEPVYAIDTEHGERAILSEKGYEIRLLKGQYQEPNEEDDHEW